MIYEEVRVVTHAVVLLFCHYRLEHCSTMFGTDFLFAPDCWKHHAPQWGTRTRLQCYWKSNVTVHRDLRWSCQWHHRSSCRTKIGLCRCRYQQRCSTMFADRILLRILFNDLIIIMYHWYFMFMAFTAKCGTSNTLALFKVCFLCLLIHLYQRRFVYLPLVVAQTLWPLLINIDS